MTLWRGHSPSVAFSSTERAFPSVFVERAIPNVFVERAFPSVFMDRVFPKCLRGEDVPMQVKRQRFSLAY